MAFKECTDLIANLYRWFFLYYQQIYFQRFCVQVIFFFKDQPVPALCKLQAHCRHKTRMPLYFLSLIVISFVGFNYNIPHAISATVTYGSASMDFFPFSLCLPFSTRAAEVFPQPAYDIILFVVHVLR